MYRGFSKDLNKGFNKILGGYKNGGKVQKTGLYVVHKGEVVVPRNIVKRKVKKGTNKKK